MVGDTCRHRSVSSDTHLPLSRRLARHISKGKNKAFDYDENFHFTLHDLKDKKEYLKSKEKRDLAKKVLDRYHEVIASPNMKRKGAEELKRYMTDEDWLPYVNQTQSQTRLYGHLSCNGSTRPILHFAGWLIAITIFTNIPLKITAWISFWWGEEFLQEAREYDYFSSRELSEKKQAKKVQGLVGADFEDKFAKAEVGRKLLRRKNGLHLMSSAEHLTAGLRLPKRPIPRLPD